MNKKKVLFGFAAGILLVCVIAFFCRYGNKKNAYSCYRIPLIDGKVAWGMDTAELISVIGEPSSIEHGEYADILTYGTGLSCDFGDCTQVVFYIGIDDKAYAGEQFSSGLGVIDITVDGSSKESILKELSDFYGELSSDGGETQMEAQLKASNPDYFNQYHFCEKWRVSTLPEDAFERLVQVQETTVDRISVPIDENTPLMYVNFWGTDGNLCTIQLNATVLASYLNIEN